MVVIPIHKEFLSPLFWLWNCSNMCLPQIFVPPVRSTVEQYPVHCLAWDMNIYKDWRMLYWLWSDYSRGPEPSKLCVHLVDHNKIVSQKENTFAEKRSCWWDVMTMDEIWQVFRTWRRNTNDWKLNWHLMSQLSRLCKKQQRSWWMSPILVFLKLNRLVSNNEILQDRHLS